MVNPSILTKMITTALLSVVAVVLFLLNRKSKTRLFCMIAMILCSLGDVFMTNLFKINGTVTMAIGATLFIAGHLCYAYMFKLLINEKNGKLLNVGLYIGIAVALVPEITMIILSYTIATEPTFILYALFVPVYVIIIGIHICANFAYGWTLKNWRGLVLAIAVTLFYTTDVWIFLDMYNLCDIESLIWHFYPLAQLCIIVFSTWPLVNKKKPVAVATEIMKK